MVHQSRKRGLQWQTDPTGTYPVEVAIPPPTSDERKAVERAWVQAELAATDAAMLPDSPYTDEEKTQIEDYRQTIRNPAREDTATYPAESWRPNIPRKH